MPIPFRLQTKPHIVPHCAREIDILHEDEHLLLLHKPAGLLTVPGRHPDNFDSVQSRLQARYPHPRIVHRLDLETSGLLVVALTPACTSALGRMFQRRQIDKHYVAVVDGLVAADSGRVELPIATDWPNRPLQMICTETGKTALTEYEVLARDEQCQQTRVSLKPYTGRSHQLRIHMRELGHPILGCALYAPDPVCHAAERLLLHAERLVFVHPLNGEAMDIRCAAEF